MSCTVDVLFLCIPKHLYGLAAGVYLCAGLTLLVATVCLAALVCQLQYEIPKLLFFSSFSLPMLLCLF